MHLALDDFGIGYSSLRRLYRLPIEVVKIGRSFVADLPGSRLGLQPVRAIVSMAHSLDKVAVGEGVDTEVQRERLEPLGCDALQGSLIGRPVPEDELHERLLVALPSQRGADAVGSPG